MKRVPIDILDELSIGRHLRFRNQVRDGEKEKQMQVAVGFCCMCVKQ